VFAIALAGYAFDCGAMMTPEQAMRCLRFNAVLVAWSSRPGLLQDHANGTRSLCAAVSVHGVSYSPLVLAVLPATGKSLALDSTDDAIAVHCHAPPILYTPAPLPLRI